MAGRKTNVDVMEMARLREEGWTQEQLAFHFDVSTTTIKRRMHAMGVRGDKTVTVTVDEISDLYVEGMTAHEIASHFGIAHSSVTRRLTEAGHTFDKVDNIKKHFERIHTEMWPAIKHDLDIGLSKTKVSRKHKVSLRTVDRLMSNNMYVKTFVGDLSEVQAVLDRSDTIENPKKRRAARLYLGGILDYVNAYGVLPTGSSLASAMDLSPQTVCWWFKANGLTHLLASRLVESHAASVVRRWLDEQGVVYEVNNRSILHPYEIDFHVAELSLGFEVNPTTSHHAGLKRISSNYHRDKSLKALDAGVRLVHVYDWDIQDGVLVIPTSILYPEVVPRDSQSLVLNLDKPVWSVGDLTTAGFVKSGEATPSAHIVGQGSSRKTVYDAGHLEYTRQIH